MRFGTGNPSVRIEPGSDDDLHDHEGENAKSIQPRGPNERRLAIAGRQQKVFAVELDDVTGSDAKRRAVHAFEELAPTGQGVVVGFAERAEVGMFAFEAGPPMVERIVSVDPVREWVPRGQHRDAAENAV